MINIYDVFYFWKREGKFMGCLFLQVNFIFNMKIKLELRV